MAKHTAGPWHWQNNSNGVPGRAKTYRVLIGNGGKRRVLRQAPYLIQAAAADEALIAAAPDLLAACEESLRLLVARSDMAEIDDDEKRHIGRLKAVIVGAAPRGEP